MNKTEQSADAQASPNVSIVIPVFNGGLELEDCLAAIAASAYPVHECILVDDGSTDGLTAPAAERHGARLIQLETQSGPAVARNRGAAEASGDIIFFTDADVLLHPDALSIAVNVFQSEPEVSAVFGSYDDNPGHTSFLSQYRNLFHHWIHQTGNETASTFWTGCGAVRKEVFNRFGGFSEDYSRPSIEDIELGGRMYQSGLRIRLAKSMFCTHMKNWKFWNIIRTDVFQRGVPWVALLLGNRDSPRDLNLNLRSRVATLIAGLLLLSLLLLPFIGHAAAIVPGLAFLLVASSGIRRSWRGGREPGISLLLVVLGLIVPVIGYRLVPDPMAVIPVILILALVGSHFAFYKYIARIRSGAFAISVVPMQFLFFLGCLLSVPLGYVRHLAGKR